MSYHWDDESQAWLQADDKKTSVVRARCIRLAPEKYAASVMPHQFWLDTFQDLLHELLESYMNGGGLRWQDRLLQRPMEAPHGWVAVGVQKAWELAVNKLEEDCKPFQASTQGIPEGLANLYELLERQIALHPCKGTKTSVHLAGEDHLDPHPQLTMIQRIFSEVETSNQSQSMLLVQGSVGTRQQIGYSDLDLWMIVSNEALADPHKLRQLAKATFRINRCLFAFDPLQHHGVMLSSQIDMYRYRESYLPVDAIAKASSLSPGQGSKLVFHVTPSSLGSGMSYFNMLSYLRSIVEKGTEIRTPFAIKGVLSCIMLLPALFEGAMGRPTFKGDSFDRVEKIVPFDIWSIMTEVSGVREGWNYRPPLLVNVVQNYVRNPFVFQYLLQRGLSGNLNHAYDHELPSNWQQRSLALAEYLWEHLCQSSTTSLSVT